MGTEKYPKENDYYSYLSEHSGKGVYKSFWSQRLTWFAIRYTGYANAFTGTENTNYFFEVGHQWLEGALDRFSRFFIDPLFSESCTERELRAVDSGKSGNHACMEIILLNTLMHRAQEKSTVRLLAYRSSRKNTKQPKSSLASLWDW